MLVWVATLRDGTTLREDAEPWCDWHAGLDSPWHASACLAERDVARICVVDADGSEAAAIDVPPGARALCERLQGINLITGAHIQLGTRVAWERGDEKRWVTA